MSKITNGFSEKTLRACGDILQLRRSFIVRRARTMSNSSGNSLDVLARPLGALEGNVLIAGLEIVAAFFISRAILFQSSLLPELPEKWNWQYSLWTLFSVVALFLLGLIVEGLAGLAERWIVGDRKGQFRRWYRKYTNPPLNWGPAQRWIWESPQAAAEFGRRRLRILVARNTAVVTFLLWGTLFLGLLITQPPGWGYWWFGSFTVGAVLIAVFGYLWLDANKAWNRAVRDVGENDRPQTRRLTGRSTGPRPRSRGPSAG